MPLRAEPGRARSTDPVRGGRTGRLRHHPFAGRFLVASSLLLVIMAMWSVGSPVPSGPDEDAQLNKAAAVARGTLIGTPVPGHRSGGLVDVKVPQTVANAELESVCDYFLVDLPACSVKIEASSKLVTVGTYEGRYPPVYYFLTGLPTRLGSGDWTLHAMRLVSALICALLLGAAFACAAAYARSGLLTVATALVVTPTVLYIASVVNPSAMEIAGGIAMWVALVVIFMHRADDPPMPAVVTATIGAMAMCASRPLSTAWYGLAISTLVVLRPAAARALLALRRIRIALAVSLLFALGSGLFVLIAKSYELEAFPLAGKPSFTAYVLDTVGHGTKVLRQVIGAFGAPDFSVPQTVLAIWMVAGFGLLVTACLLAAHRDAIVLLGSTVLFGFVLPFVIIFTHIKADGVVWQGRYSLPLIAGLPLIAAALVAERHPVAVGAMLGRITLFAIPAFTAGCVVAFYWYLRRYTVGLAFSRANAFRHYSNSWTPVMAPEVIFVVLVLASLTFAGWLFRQILRPSAQRSRTIPVQPSESSQSSTGPSRPVHPL